MSREFGQITVILFYIPGPDFEGAAVVESYNDLLARSADQLVFVLGDFNSRDLSSHLPTLQQYVNCPTHLTRILDKCYGNMHDAYKSFCQSAVGKSNHLVVHLFPQYRAKLRREKPLSKVVHVCTDDSTEALRDCLEDADWEIFFDSCDNLDELTKTVTAYVSFCESNVTDTKTVRLYPNNKKWITSELKVCVNEKRVAFSTRNLDLVKEKKI